MLPTSDKSRRVGQLDFFFLIIYSPSWYLESHERNTSDVSVQLAFIQNRMHTKLCQYSETFIERILDYQWGFTYHFGQHNFFFGFIRKFLTWSSMSRVWSGYAGMQLASKWGRLSRQHLLEHDTMVLWHFLDQLYQQSLCICGGIEV